MRGGESRCLTYTAAGTSVRHHPPNYCMESRPGCTIWLCVCYQVSGSGLGAGGWGWGGGEAACVVGGVCLGEIRKTKNRGTS